MAICLTNINKETMRDKRHLCLFWVLMEIILYICGSLKPASMNNNTSTVFADTKQHYELLDALRGVAALLVMFYHIHEGFQFASGAPTVGGINHGYLAVDFFFILSGFVISYAYDDRWKTTLTLGNFFRRRLIRLHPMVIMGAVIGVVSFCVSGCERWDGSHVATSTLMLALLCMMFFVPAVPGMARDVRGNGEMFPLNGPCWSLFFEYIGNIVYALMIRRLSTKMLKALVAVLAVGYTVFAVGNFSGYGSMGVGWTLDAANFFGGLIRMMFPFSMGMLLSRTFKPKAVRGAFWICTVALIALFAVPYLYIDSLQPLTLNGIYESFCVAVAFPFLVWIGASGETTDSVSSTICKFLGDISYPVYVVHYPLMYIFYKWLIKHEVYTLSETWPQALCTYIGSTVLAYLCLRLYDIPVRRWLSKTFMKKKQK